MKKLSILVITAAMIMTTAGLASAQPRNGLTGLVVGAGSGAIVGQAIARDAEGIIAASVIGGTIGLIIGSELDHRHLWVPPVPPVPRIRYVVNNHNVYRHADRDRGTHRRPTKHDRDERRRCRR